MTSRIPDAGVSVFSLGHGSLSTFARGDRRRLSWSSQVSETKKPQLDDDTAIEAAPEPGPSVELTDKDLDQAVGGLWPYVVSNNGYNKTI